MSRSPIKQPLDTSHLPAPSPSPRLNRVIRKLQSARDLTSSGPPSPSLITQQLQQQKLHQEHLYPDLQSPSPSSSPTKSPSHTRTRSHSDAAVHGTSREGVAARRSAAKRAVAIPTPSSALASSRRLTLDLLLREGPLGGDVVSALREMRYLILTDGVLSDGDGMSAMRIYVWLILLSAPSLSTETYLSLVHRGPSPSYSKIRNDTFRTLATDVLFRRRVSEASLIRLLNAIAWQLHDTRDERSWAEDPSEYVQGMNVLAAPFLYVARSEAEAFVAFHRFLTLEVPGYVRGAMDGVHRGLALVDKVLAVVDPKLSAYLMSKSMHAELYAFPSVLTLCACTPPLPEVLHLWDFFFAYGAHLNLLCIVAQLVMMRDTIIGSPSPTKILRSFPPLQATKVKMIAISLVKKIPDDLYDEIVIHAK